MKISIAQRIKRAMIGLTLVLCLVFTLLAMLMVYVVEDQVFINLLKHEQQRFEQLPMDEQASWQPSNQSMRVYLNEEAFPAEMSHIIGQKPGIYEYFEDGTAWFLLRANSVVSGQEYLISFDVSGLLAVRSGRSDLWALIGVVSLFLLLFSVWIASRLAKKTLSPLRQLTQQFQDENNELPKGFAADFYGDEIGVLAQQLEQSIAQANQAAIREFEFNRGVSHELRTPIQIAQNALELLHIKGELPLSKNQAVMNRLNRAITQMKQITEAFLWLVSDHSAMKESCDGQTVINELRQAYQNSHPNRPISIELSGNLSYKAPALVLKIILDNLLRNAMQHSDGGSVKCILNDQFICIENAVSKAVDQPGYGIGLSIVARLCEKLNWDLKVHSESAKFFKVVIHIVLE